jgi:hypothetical protein
MKKRLELHMAAACLTAGLCAAFGQTGTSVRLATELDSRTVPLNRTVILTVSLTWEGPLGGFEITEMGEPSLSNLEITGAASTNRASGTQSVKSVSYTLKPKALGMAYVEPVFVTYTDASAGSSKLRTQRLSVEVVAPLPEPGRPSPLWWIIPIVAAALAAGGYFIFKKKPAPPVTEPVKPLGEKYLEQLKVGVQLTTKNRREAVSALSKLLRRFLSERDGIPATGMTTEALLSLLTERGVSEKDGRAIESVLRMADRIVFSGAEASQAELDEAYTHVESMFESAKREESVNLSTDANKDNK